ELTPQVFAEQVDAEWAHLRDGPATLTQQRVDEIARRFTTPTYAQPAPPDENEALARADARFARWLRTNVHPHRVAGYAAVTASLKVTGIAPGDITSEQMDAVADLADRYSFGEIRVTHEQNVVF